MRYSRPLRGPAKPAIEFSDLLRIGVPWVAVKRCEFGDQLRNSDTELGGSGLEHVGGLLVHLDADVGTHGTRIADPETVKGGVSVGVGGSIPTRGLGVSRPQMLEGERVRCW